MHRTPLITLATSSLLAGTTIAAPPAYEDLPLGATFAAGDGTASDGVPIDFGCFEYASGTITCNGSAEIKSEIPGCNSRNRLELMNLSAKFDYAGSIGSQIDPIFAFGEYGGNINLAVNGDFRNFANMLDIDGIPIGGCVAKVLSGGTGGDCGRIQFIGTVDVLTVGGQEFWWDGTRGCDIDFEDLTLGDMFPAVSSFATGGVPVTIRELFNPTSPPTFGEAIVEAGGLACSVGNELWTRNCRASFEFMAGPGPVTNLSIQFGEYGGHVNVSVNGDLRIVANLRDLHGSNVGGTTISVPSGGFGGDCGEMFINGVVNEFEIGGQELWIDCLRFDADPNGGGDECEDAYVDHSDLPLSGSWAVGDTLTTGGVDVSISDFQSSFGPLSGGVVTSDAQLACGDDYEFGTYNVQATYDFAGSIGTLVNLNVLVSDQGGEVNLGVNGAPVANAADYADLDGATIGGATITVISGGRDGDCTELRIQGTVERLTLGGQQHFIDCIWAEDIMPPTKTGDLNGDGCVDSADVGLLLSFWGTADGDINGDGNTDAADFGELLANWGC